MATAPSCKTNVTEVSFAVYDGNDDDGDDDIDDETLMKQMQVVEVGLHQEKQLVCRMKWVGLLDFRWVCLFSCFFLYLFVCLFVLLF